MNYNKLTKLSDKYGIILASGSPRRFSLLSEIGISFTRKIPQIEETSLENEQPYKYAERLAVEKAAAVASTTPEGHIVIGCDTTVVLDNTILGKPTDKTDALRILSTLSGKEHVVCTAVAFSKDNKTIISGYELTTVFFNQVSRDKILDYIDSGEPMDKAGAYGIQGMGAFLVDRIEGNLDNVIGLPRKLLEKFAGEIIDNERH